MNLHEACEAGDMERVRVLVAEGACVRAARASDGDTPLHIACRRSLLDLATFLYERGGDMTVRNADGYAPFHLLRDINHTHLPLPPWVVDRRHIDVQDAMGRTLLYMRARDEIGSFLLSYGADPHIETATHDSAFIMLLKLSYEYGDSTAYLMAIPYVRPCDVGRTFGDNVTLMHVAAAHGDVHLVRKCIRAGLDVNAATSSGDTPLLACVSRCGSSQSRANVFFALIRAGAFFDCKNHEGLSPLHKACCSYHPHMIKKLVALGADINAETASGWTPLRYLRLTPRSQPVADELIKRGARRDCKTKMHLACEQGRLRDVLQCIRANASAASFTDIGGYTPLMSACAGGHADIVRVVLDHGGASTGESEMNPLYIACERGHAHAAHALIVHPSFRPHLSFIDKAECFNVAHRNGHESTVRLLFRANIGLPSHHLFRVHDHERMEPFRMEPFRMKTGSLSYSTSDAIMHVFASGGHTAEKIRYLRDRQHLERVFKHPSGHVAATEWCVALRPANESVPILAFAVRRRYERQLQIAPRNYAPTLIADMHEPMLSEIEITVHYEHEFICHSTHAFFVHCEAAVEWMEQMM